MKERLRVVVSGLIGQYPMGGVTWDYIQYLLGMKELGHDVFYVEDSNQWPYDPAVGGGGLDATYNATYVDGIMERFGLADRWAFRFLGGYLPERWFGMSDGRRREVLESADLLINVSSGIGEPERYRTIPCLAYVDTDPVFTQIRAVQDEAFRAHLDLHDLHFTYGEVASDTVPDTGHHWRPMRKPIALGEWHPEAPKRDVFTTVLNWTSYGDVRWEGRSYGQKDAELLRFIDLPQRVSPAVLELALGPGITRRAPLEMLRRRGWRLVDPMKACADVDSYRRYIESSLGEWTVAKNGYVVGQSGWFSGRTACYLAAGRPVVVQDTGFGPVLPVGEGILAFRTVDEAVAAVAEVLGDYERHARAARAIAETHFGAAGVVGRLLDRSSVHA